MYKTLFCWQGAAQIHAVINRPEQNISEDQQAYLAKSLVSSIDQGLTGYRALSQQCRWWKDKVSTSLHGNIDRLPQLFNRPVVTGKESLNSEKRLL